MLARFLSPDPYVQMPDYTQNFNRYSYCLNNPFKYTDPSGESIIAIIGGAIIGGIGYTASVAFSDYGLCAWSSNDCVKSMAVGAISGAVTCGIGSVFGTTGSIVQGTFDVGKELARAGAHALANGFISVATGNDFLNGFVAGGMGSFGGSLFQGMAGGIIQAHPILEAIGTVGSSAVSGGVGAELTGGDFWRGAATGAIVGVFNHLQGEIIEKRIEQKRLDLARSATKRWDVVKYKHCNEFVQDMMIENEMNPTDKALLAREWGDIKQVKSGWRPLQAGETPDRGDIAAAKYRFDSGATGHMGIMLTSERICYAGGSSPYVSVSNINTIKFENTNKPNWVYYRYIGN